MQYVRFKILFFIAAWVLLLGVARAASPAANEHWVYNVVKGDTLVGIAESYLGPRSGWRDLRRLKNVRNPRRLMPGQPLRIQVAWLRRDTTVAEVLRVHGDVRVGNTFETSTPLTTSTVLRVGDVIHAAEQSNATIRFVDGSRLLVAQNSRVSVERLLVYGKTGLGETRLRLEQGSTDTHVSPPPGLGPRFEIQTPTMHLGVRGTDFRVRVDPIAKLSHAEVLRGQVAASGNRSEVLVNDGFGTLADAIGIPKVPRALMAAPDLRALTPRLLERVPLRLTWPALADAQAYRAQVFVDRQFDQLLLDGVFDKSVARWTDLSDGNYVLRVRALDAGGLEGLNADADFVLKARPEPPFVHQPGESAKIYGDTVVFEWTRHAQAARYRLQVSDSEEFTAKLIDSSTLSDTTHSMQLAPGRYHWRMASIRADGDQGPLGGVQSFELRKIPESPAMEAPAVNDDQVQLRWRAGEPGGSFQFQFATDPEFEHVLVDKLTSETTVVPPRPGPGKYHLRVKTIAADGFAGPFGATQEMGIPLSKWWLLLPTGLILRLF